MGGNTLGLYGAIFAPHGTSALAHGFQGAFHMWNQQQVILPHSLHVNITHRNLCMHILLRTSGPQYSGA